MGSDQTTSPLRWFGLLAQLPRTANIILATPPFIILVALYVYGARARHIENPDDKVMPTMSQMWKGIKSTAFEKDRNDEYRLWKDTWSSLRRFGIGLGLAAVVGLIVGLNLGMLPLLRATGYPFLLFLSLLWHP